VEAGIDAFNVAVFDCEPPPEPDLTCDGDLTWDNVNAGETVTTTISIENIGTPDSELDWEFCECPEWGEWTFTPSSGEDLKPEDGAIIVQVEVVAPNQQNQEFTGEVKLINMENSYDFDILPVILKTPKNKILSNTLILGYLQRLPNMFPLLELIIQRLGL
jgi:hypothetical protein